jgi:hypothetical protein
MSVETGVQLPLASELGLNRHTESKYSFYWSYTILSPSAR